MVEPRNLYNYKLMPFRPVSLAIVDDHILFRNILQNYLSKQENIQVAIQATDMADLFEKLKHTSIDVLIVNVFIPGLDVNESIKSLRSNYPDIKVLILSRNTDIGSIAELLNAGIHGYFSKSDEPEELLQAIQIIAENRVYRNRILTEALYWSKQTNIKSRTTKPIISFSEREIKILQLIWEEKGNKEIADELLLGVRSVEKIRQEMKEKVGALSTVGLLKHAISRRIIEPEKAFQV